MPYLNILLLWESVPPLFVIEYKTIITYWIQNCQISFLSHSLHVYLEVSTTPKYVCMRMHHLSCYRTQTALVQLVLKRPQKNTISYLRYLHYVIPHASLLDLLHYPSRGSQLPVNQRCSKRYLNCHRQNSVFLRHTSEEASHSCQRNTTTNELQS